MRSNLVTTLIAASLLTGSAALASQPTIGPVASYDRSSGTFVISGEEYLIPEGVPRTGLANGYQVSVQWAPMGDVRVVRSLQITSRGSDN